MASPRPKPSALKELAGNPGHRPLNENEPTRLAGVPERPKTLRGAARKHWDYLAKMLDDAGILSQIESASLALLCEMWKKCLDAERAMNKSGGVVLYEYHENGTLKSAKKNPAFAVWIECVQQYRLLCVEFGMTPSSRSKIHVPKVKQVAKDKAARAATYFADEDPDARLGRPLLV